MFKNFVILLFSKKFISQKKLENKISSSDNKYKTESFQETPNNLTGS